MSNNRIFPYGVVFAGITLLAACAQNPPVPELGLTRDSVAAARANQSLMQTAPKDIAQAERYLGQADNAAKSGKTLDAQHYAYMARRQIDIAQARTDQRETVAEAQEQARIQAQTNQSTVLGSYNLVFETGKSTLTPGAQNQLQSLVNVLRANPSIPVTISGHTDSTGAPEKNRQLSQDRAQSVVDFLASQGIDPTRLTARGMGEDYPVASNANSAGRQLNRRVDVEIASLAQ